VSRVDVAGRLLHIPLRYILIKPRLELIGIQQMVWFDVCHAATLDFQELQEHFVLPQKLLRTLVDICWHRRAYRYCRQWTTRQESDHLVNGFDLAFDGVLLRHVLLDLVEGLAGHATPKRLGYSDGVDGALPAIAAEPALQDFEDLVGEGARGCFIGREYQGLLGLRENARHP